MKGPTGPFLCMRSPNKALATVLAFTELMNTTLKPSWSSKPPEKVGRYRWRHAEGQPEYSILVSLELSIRGEVAFCWRCWELTDFSALDAGGEWLFVAEAPCAELPQPVVDQLLQDPLAWKPKMPHKDGRYLVRLAENSAPVLVRIFQATAQSTQLQERFIDSYGHSLLPELQAACRFGSWAEVPANVHW